MVSRSERLETSEKETNSENDKVLDCTGMPLGVLSKGDCSCRIRNGSLLSRSFQGR
jgi:hypothetical protein